MEDSKFCCLIKKSTRGTNLLPLKASTCPSANPYNPCQKFKTHQKISIIFLSAATSILIKYVTVVLPYTSQHRGQSNRCFRCASCWSSFLLVELARWSGAGEHGAGGYKNLGGWDTAYRRLALMTSARRCVLFSLYTISTLLSMFLIYLSAFHCQFVAVNGCTPLEKQNQFTQIVAVFFACYIIIFSLCWLFANCQRVENSYLNNYNFLEMPNAVFCSLLAGVACVIEIHYNFDYTEIEWTQKWTMAALVAGILSCLHASLAFALT